MAQNQGFLEERAHWEEERQVWELTKRTLTEGCWAMNVVDGDPDHPQNLIRWSEQFRELIGYSRVEFPDGWDSYFKVVNQDDLKAVMQAFNASMVDKSGDGHIEKVCWWAILPRKSHNMPSCASTLSEKL